MNILIVKTSAFGDIVQCYGVLEYLKSRFPDCKIDWVVEKRMKPLISGHPAVSRTIEIDTKGWRENWWRTKSYREMLQALWDIRQEEYSAVFDLQSNVKSSLVTLFARAPAKVGFGFKTAHEPISSLFLNRRIEVPAGLNIRQEYLYIVQKYFNDFYEPTTSTLINQEAALPASGANWMVCPGSNWQNKQLPEEVLIQFLKLCQEQYHPRFVFLSGSQGEFEQATRLAKEFSGSEVLAKPSLGLLQHVMSRMELVLSMDSLPLHLAATAGCPTYSFFGPSSGQKFAPIGPKHGVFQGSCPYNETFVKRCDKLRTCPTGACLRAVSADTLFTAFSSWFSR